MASHVAVGCSIGSAVSAVAVSRAENSEVIANSDGHRTTPVAVAYGEESLSIGVPAIQGLSRNAKNTALGFVQLLGRKFDDTFVQATLGSYSCKVADKDGQPMLMPEALEEGVAPSTLVTELLKTMWETAATNAGSDCAEIVLAVPHSASEEYKDALAAASVAANVQVKSLVSEPVAVAIGYGLGAGEEPQDETVLIYDLGAAKATATVIKVENGCYKVLASVNDTNLGGNAFDKLLVAMLVKEFKKTSKVDISNEKKAMTKLRLAAIEAKHILATTMSTTVAVESLYEGQDFQFKLSKGKFDSTLSSLHRKSTGPIDAALTSCGLKKDELSRVFLAGGSCKMGKVKKTLNLYFEREIVVDSIAPDEVTALGASRHGVHRSGVNKELLESLHVYPNAICVKTADGEYAQIIPPKSLVPAKVELELACGAADQGSISLEVFERVDGESDPKPLAAAVLNDVGSSDDSSICGTVEILKDGTLKVAMSDSKSGKSVQGAFCVAR